MMKTKEMAMPMPADATNNKIGSRKRASFVQSKMYIDREEAHVAIFHFIQLQQRRSIAVPLGREVRPAFFVSGRRVAWRARQRDFRPRLDSTRLDQCHSNPSAHQHVPRQSGIRIIIDMLPRYRAAVCVSEGQSRISRHHQASKPQRRRRALG